MDKKVLTWQQFINGVPLDLCDKIHTCTKTDCKPEDCPAWNELENLPENKNESI